MKYDKKISINKTDEEISEELVGSYGSTLVMMSSNPEELLILKNKLRSEYKIVMDLTLLENKDYAMVLVREV